MSSGNYNTNFAFLVLSCCLMIHTISAQTSQSASPTTVTVQPDSNWCLGCICEAISSCDRSLKCEGDVCGLFRITWAYWADAGKPTVNNEDPKSNTGISVN